MTRDDEGAKLLWQEGLPPSALLLAPSVAATPMRHPTGTWAMLVLASDVLDDPDREGEVALFAGSWLPVQPQAATCEGDLVLLLSEPDGEPTSEDQVDVEMLFAHGGRWLRVGEWERLDARWPWTVAVTAAVIMALHVEAIEAAFPSAEGTSPPLRGYGRHGGLADLIEAGLVQPGDEFVWDRPKLGARHTARVRRDGTLALANGSVYANPSGALTALGGKHQNGWITWKRMSDGRCLGDLRGELRTRRGLPVEPRRLG